MPPKSPASPPAARAAAAFKKLSEASVTLNHASDELAKAVAPVDAALQRLNLGTPCWHRYATSQDQDGNVTVYLIGYAKINGRWGLSLSATDEAYDGNEWLFNEAPRAMRIEAIDQIPPLLEKLASEARKAAADLTAKLEAARAIAESLSDPVADDDEAVPF